jgi:hypothetical protein
VQDKKQSLSPLFSESFVNIGLLSFSSLFSHYRLFFVIPAQARIQHFLKKFSISSTEYPDLDPITESILVYALLLHCQENRPYDIMA